jgi:outer membrane protein OmpA-like peptidoglycan-associated protein
MPNKLWLALVIFPLLLSHVYAQDKRALFYLDQGEREFKLRKYPEALSNFEKYFQRDSSSQLAHLRTAQIYESFRNTKKATEFYKKTIKFDTAKVHHPQAYMYLGMRALENSSYEESKKYLTIAQENTNKNAQAYQQILKELKKVDLGLKAMANPLNITPKRLPSVVNAKRKQYFPVLTADGNTLIFTAEELQKDNSEEFEENIYISKKINGEWQTPEEISENINTPFNEGTCSITADGKIMVFTACESSRKSFGSCDLFITRKEGDQWSEPENMGPFVNSQYWDSQPSLSPDGSQIFFSSDRPFGVGKKDLWMSELDDNGKWKRAVNLGSKINTPLDEVSPFVHANGQTLFYSSNGREGLGKHDIYMTNIAKDFSSESINLGYPINTNGDESGLFISANGETAFYSVQKKDSINIYEFQVPQELSTQFDKIYYIKGFIRDSKDNKPLYSTIEVVNSTSGDRISKFLSDPITGDYMTVLPQEGEYLMYIETPGYFFKSIKFDFKEGRENKELDVSLSKIEKQSKETLNNIFFDTGSAKLRSDSDVELRKLTEMLKRNSKLTVEISGHTDDVGNDKANLELSNQRAKAVVDYLKQNGIAENRLISIGYGETQPKVTNSSETNRQLNRRIELKIL